MPSPKLIHGIKQVKRSLHRTDLLNCCAAVHFVPVGAEVEDISEIIAAGILKSAVKAGDQGVPGVVCDFEDVHFSSFLKSGPGADIHLYAAPGLHYLLWLCRCSVSTCLI